MLLFSGWLEGRSMQLAIEVSDERLEDHYIYLYKLGGTCIDSARIFNSQCQFYLHDSITIGYEFTLDKDDFINRRLSFLVENDFHNIYLYKDENDSWDLIIDSNLDKEFKSKKDSIIVNFLEFFRSSDESSCDYLNIVFRIFSESFQQNRNIGIYLTYLLWEEIELLIRHNKKCNINSIQEYQINVGKLLKDSIDNDIDRLKSAFSMLEGDTIEDFTFSDRSGNLISTLEFRGQLFILYFNANWCLDARKTDDEFEYLYKQKEKYKPFNLVSIEADAFKYYDYTTAYSWIQGYLQNYQQKIFIDNIYRITGYPTIFVINSKGIIIKRNPSMEEILSQLK